MSARESLRRKYCTVESSEMGQDVEVGCAHDPLPRHWIHGPVVRTECAGMCAVRDRGGGRTGSAVGRGPGRRVWAGAVASLLVSPRRRRRRSAHVHFEDLADGDASAVQQDSLVAGTDVEQIAHLGSVETEHVPQRHDGTLNLG
jgi:hypothetical protein